MQSHFLLVLIAHSSMTSGFQGNGFTWGSPQVLLLRRDKWKCTEEAVTSKTNTKVGTSSRNVKKKIACLDVVDFLKHNHPIPSNLDLTPLGIGAKETSCCPQFCNFCGHETFSIYKRFKSNHIEMNHRGPFLIFR